MKALSLQKVSIKPDIFWNQFEYGERGSICLSVFMSYLPENGSNLFAVAEDQQKIVNRPSRLWEKAEVDILICSRTVQGKRLQGV